MTERLKPVQPLLTLTGDEDAAMCGPDGCTIPANHPALAPATAIENDTKAPR